MKILTIRDNFNFHFKKTNNLNSVESSVDPMSIETKHSTSELRFLKLEASLKKQEELLENFSKKLKEVRIKQVNIFVFK